ncbi:MAG: amidohydrolase family protein, partial [Alphaproteobacteria bacterium]|nr:amidohydrolase family protein [Alphaproteobacteria bacterium]
MTKCKAFAVVADGWFDGEVFHRQRTSLRIAGGVIEDIQPGDFGVEAKQADLAVARVPFLMPGLVDAHVHLFLDGGPTDLAVRSAHLKKALDELTEAARQSARASVAAGVSLVRDAGDKHGINNAIRAEAKEPGSGLPQVRSGGIGIRAPKRYGAFMATEVADQDTIRKTTVRLAHENDEVKLILTGIIDFEAGAVTDEPQFNLDDVRLVVETARAEGRSVFAHCSGLKGLQIAAAAGVGSIEHGFFMTRGVLETMLKNDVAWSPTFSPVHAQWANPAPMNWSEQTIGNLARILDSHAAHLKLAHEMGVTLLLGTDAGSMGVEHGKAMLT